MLDVGWQIGVFCLSWLFWFVVMSGYTYFFQRKIRKPLSQKDHIVLAVGKVSLFCAIAAAVRIILWLRH